MEPYLPNQKDPELFWYQGRPVRIKQRLKYGDKVYVQIDFGNGTRKQVDFCELHDRNILNLPDQFKIVLELLRNLYVKLNSDPLANQYNIDDLIGKLQDLSDAIVATQRQLQTIQWGNVTGTITSQADLMTALAAKIDRTEFQELFNQSMNLYLNQVYHQQPLPPFQP